MIDGWLERIFFEKIKWLRSFICLISYIGLSALTIAIVLKYLYPVFGMHKIFGYNPRVLWLNVLLCAGIGMFSTTFFPLLWYGFKTSKRMKKGLVDPPDIEVRIARKIVKRFPNCFSK